MGSTNSVQPYCRLAIITMQTMLAASWPHRVLSEAMVGALIVVVLVVTYSSLGDAAVTGPSGLFLFSLTCEAAIELWFKHIFAPMPIVRCNKHAGCVLCCPAPTQCAYS